LTVAISHGELTKLGWLQRTCATHAFRKLKSLSGGSMLTFRKIALISTLVLAPLTSAWADPPIIVDPPATILFCASVTGANHFGKGVELQFDTLNWTDVPAYDLTYNLNTLASTGGTFGSASVNVGGAGNKFGHINNWTVQPTPILPTRVRWETAGPGLPNVDVWVENDRVGTPKFGGGPVNGQPANGRYLTNEELLRPIPATGLIPFKDNELDGFRVIFPEFEVGERIVFDWALSGADGETIREPLSNGGYNRGVIQLDRASDGPNGEIRLMSFVWPGRISGSIATPFPEVDLIETDKKAITIPPISNVPEPSALLLALSALALPFVRKMRQPS
jgi:hypothetical protein